MTGAAPAGHSPAGRATPRPGLARAGLAGLAGLTATGLILAAGCSSSADAGRPAAGGSSGVSVVASTNVYGDIARQIAGDKVGITSVISDPAQDPHSYEADSKTQLALSRARIVIENGGGYDDFMDTMLRGAHSSATVLNVVSISGRTAPAAGDLNEHLWYDFPTMRRLVDKLLEALSSADAADAATFRTNAATFTRHLAALEATEGQIRAAHAGTGVAVTEPVPLYLLQACGLVNKTPEEFSKAIEEGTDIAPRVLQQTIALFTGKQVTLLAYNQQTAGPETAKVSDAAKANGIAVVPVTETLPAGKDYLAWMTDNLTAVRDALSH
jgi:zinc/manganese transport system substrate-binding protein